MIGGMQTGLNAMLGQNEMGAANNIRFFKRKEITDLIMMFFENIKLRNIEKKDFLNSFSKEDISDLYQNTYFFHYLLQYCAKPGKHSTITQ